MAGLGQVTPFLCVLVLPSSLAVGWKAPPGVVQWLSTIAQLLPGISHPSLNTRVYSGACPGIRPHEDRNISHSWVVWMMPQ